MPETTVRRFHRFVFVLLLGVLTPACGEDGDPYWCEDRAVTVCHGWESPATLLPQGSWSGTYDGGFHHLLFEQPLAMRWDYDVYTLDVGRQGAREVFFRGGTFSHTDALGRSQNSFRAWYSPYEPWEFRGAYTVSSDTVYLRGRVYAEGEDIGPFELSRPRLCIDERTGWKDSCSGEIRYE